MLKKIFNQIPIFTDFAPEQLTLLEDLFKLVSCRDEEIIFEQDTAADFLYIVVEGEVVIYFKPDDGERITVARIETGGVFGWSAAFGSGAYTSGATCTTAAKLLKVRGEALKTLRQKHPETGILLLERLATVVAERLQHSSAQDQVVALLEHALTNGIQHLGG